MVVAALPAELVVSPVRAGNAAAGKLVAFVKFTALGVPRLGVVKAGDVASTTVLPLPVVVAATNCLLPFVPTTVALVGIEAPSTCTTVVAAVPAVVVTSPVSAGSAVAGSAVAFVRFSALGVPRAGVTKVGEVASTTEPVPVVVSATS